MTIPPPRYDPVGDMQKAQREHDIQDHLNKVTGSGRYAGGPTDGAHFTMANVFAGLGVAFVVWWAVQFVGLNPLWAIPAGMVAIPLSGLLLNRNRRRPRTKPRAGRRITSPVRFFVALGAAVGAALGVWFAMSEGDIPILRAAVTFGVIGAVLGFVPGLLVKARRAVVDRRATRV